MNSQVQVNEEVVAVLPSVEAAPKEKELTKALSTIEFQAESIVIKDDEDYQQAAEFGRLLKQKASEVKDFFKPMKEQANKAHKAVCDREKMMLTPLTNAELTLKRTMGDYNLEQERKRKALEEELRRKAQEEADRKLAEAIAAEESGDTEQAAASMLDAQLIDQASRSNINIERPKADGAYVTKDWEIVEIDQAIVPLSVQGIPIRPVDTAAVMRLIRASKGNIQIPGIVYKETAKMNFRK